MKITELGTYTFTEDTRLRYGISVGTFTKGMQFTVVQLNLGNSQFYAPEIGDWQYNEMPAVKVN